MRQERDNDPCCIYDHFDEPRGDVRADCQGCHWFALGRFFEAEEVRYRAEEHARTSGHTVAMTGIEQEVYGLDATQITPGV